MEELLKYSGAILESDWGDLIKIVSLLLLFLSIMIWLYDRYVQRDNQVLINYPLIGRFRYLFYALRDPMRQYFGDESYYDLFEKVDWVNKASHDKNLYYSYSLSKPSRSDTIKFVHANSVLNLDEVQQTFSVTFGSRHKYPFVTKSIIGRSAMSDGAISPEATQAFAKGAYLGNFPINTGEGSLTTNFLSTHTCASDPEQNRYLQIKRGTIFARSIYRLVKFFFNKEVAITLYRNLVLTTQKGTYNFDEHQKAFFRIDWKQPLEVFPQQIEDIADIIFQIGSGLYGVRDQKGDFEEIQYQKVMRFCRMTEIKIAQGAKQTGGKLLASKVTEDIAYYRRVEAHKDLISPNRFPFASTVSELFDFVGRLQTLSQKPVGIKIVISTRENFKAYTKELALRIKENRPYPDFLTIDGGDGGSGAAPIEMMSRMGLSIKEALTIVIEELKKEHLTGKIKIIASEKALTPDDIIELIAYGADFVNIARGFMISAGCIRAHECSGANGRACPVGIATMDQKKRSKFLIEQKSSSIASYHKSLLAGVRSLMAVIGVKSLNKISKEKHLM
ncbi:MAG: FMN-binding glutamate synthase family protein [Epsilonproteobacteria bacterium]|nr:FMN-binding glutamate synthase family protein [Campylobacterota bacterium]